MHTFQKLWKNTHTRISKCMPVWWCFALTPCKHHPPTAICSTLQQNREKEWDREFRGNRVESDTGALCDSLHSNVHLTPKHIQFSSKYCTEHGILNAGPSLLGSLIMDQSPVSQHWWYRLPYPILCLCKHKTHKQTTKCQHTVSRHLPICSKNVLRRKL